MIKQTLYPKTSRVNPSEKYLITEKLDGSNLTFFKLDDMLYIGQRNYIFTLDECYNNPDSNSRLYNGLSNLLARHGKNLETALVDGSAIVGEWLSMGHIKYSYDEVNRFYQFAKANVKLNEFDEYSMYNIYYDMDLFKYSYADQEKPSYINTVPVVKQINAVSIDDLNKLYDEYTDQVDRDVEGFVVSKGKGFVQKYVRMKNGKLQEHRP